MRRTPDIASQCEGRSSGGCDEAEVGRERRRHIGEGAALPNRARADRWSERQYRDLLARVVGAAPGRITAMVGGDDDNVVSLESCADVGNAPVEFFERGSIAGGIAAVSVNGVEIDE